MLLFVIRTDIPVATIVISGGRSLDKFAELVGLAHHAPSVSCSYSLYLNIIIIEHGFTSAPTQYRLYGRRFLQV